MGPPHRNAGRVTVRRAARQRRRPGDFTWKAADPTILALYNAADRADGAERRELLRMAGDLRRAIDAKLAPAALGELRTAAERRLGMLLL